MDKEIVRPTLPPSRSEAIYDHLRKQITDGELRPNQRITVQEFADFFQVSSTPIREIFQRLRAERLLYSDSANRNELKVISVSRDDVNKVFEFIKALDIFGMRAYLKTFPEPAVQDLRTLFKSLGEHYKKRDARQFNKVNLMIHQRIWQAYGNEYFYKALIDAQEKLELYIGIVPDRYYTPEVLSRSYAEHSELMDIIEKRNVKRAEEFMERHWKQDYLDRNE